MAFNEQLFRIWGSLLPGRNYRKFNSKSMASLQLYKQTPKRSTYRGLETFKEDGGKVRVGEASQEFCVAERREVRGTGRRQRFVPLGDRDSTQKGLKRRQQLPGQLIEMPLQLCRVCVSYPQGLGRVLAWLDLPKESALPIKEHRK